MEGHGVMMMLVAWILNGIGIPPLSVSLLFFWGIKEWVLLYFSVGLDARQRLSGLLLYSIIYLFIVCDGIPRGCKLA
jgi:hypothetical protein